MARRSQADRRAATRGALMETARRLFVDEGYQAVPAERIVREAGVTRGALYHHFDDKRDLFRAVFDELEAQLHEGLKVIFEESPDLRTAAERTLDGFLDVCQQPAVRQIALLDAPAVLGWEEWRAIETTHGLGLLTEMVQSVGQPLPAPAPVLARILFSASIEAALMIGADPSDTMRTDCRRALLAIVDAFMPDTAK